MRQVAQRIANVCFTSHISGENSRFMYAMVIDIGATEIKSGIFIDNELTAIKKTETEAKAGGSHVVEKVIWIIAEYKKQYRFDKIGISTAGQVNPDLGTIIYANSNIPNYTGTNLRDILQDEFDVPVYVGNDVNCAALGEAYFGAGRGISDFICLTYGTGIGGAVYLNHKLYTGNDYIAGEFGTIPTHPEEKHNVENYYEGCYENYASTTALVREAQKIDRTLCNGKIIFERMHDPLVRKIIDHWIDEIVLGLPSLIHILNPGAIILGGGVMEQKYVVDEIEKRLQCRIMPGFRKVKVLKAELGNRAGLYGAAMLCTDMKK